jgi:hypothetical protein
MLSLRACARYSLLLVLVTPLHLEGQSRASLQVWYSVANRVPVYASAQSKGRTVGEIETPSAICVVRFNDRFGEVRLFDEKGSATTGYIERFLLSNRPVRSTKPRSISAVCYPPPVVIASVPRVSDNRESIPTPRSPQPETARPADSPAAESSDRPRAELRRIALAQETFFAERQTYTTTLSDLSRYYEPTSNLTVELLEASAEHWKATVTDTRIRIVCTLEMRVGSNEDPTPECRAATDLSVTSKVAAAPRGR